MIQEAGFRITPKVAWSIRDVISSADQEGAWVVTMEVESRITPKAA